MTVNIPSSVREIKLDVVELKLDRLIEEMRFLKSHTIAFDTRLRGIEAYLKASEPSKQQPESNSRRGWRPVLVRRQGQLCLQSGQQPAQPWFIWEHDPDNGTAICALMSKRRQAILRRRRHQPRRPPPAKIRPGRPAAKAWEDENRPQLSLTGPRLAQLLQVLIGLLRIQRVERLRPLRGLRAWLDRNAWSVVAASVHSRASLRYSSRRRGSTVNSAARTQFSAWYS